MLQSVFTRVTERKQLIQDILETSAQKDFYTTFTPSTHWPFKDATSKKCRLLVLDSSFNPPTKAHAKLLETSLKAYPTGYFDGSLLLFSTNNVDKTLTGASVLQRAQMMEMIAMQCPSTAVGFTPHGRFMDKAKYINSWFAETHASSQLELYFIVGYDTMIRLLDPKYYNSTSVKDALTPFFESCRLICADRGTEDVGFWVKTYNTFDRDLIQRIQLDPITSQFSSTLAREAIQQRHTDQLNTILDPNIVAFVNENKIY
ncbi:uncharacterized protein ATC70_001865 [Mucor velutinosus]|uniref:Cytidyltransferase-like domain-containing protein n=1 Tax=Mucor velutinosus TaxID=708070 RepID=A0AAN7DD00_9FUNG|nr:hypothetical protein ATC70_001865 [Mucor velutinosus]